MCIQVDTHTYVCTVSVCALSQVPLFATPWTVARQAPLSMGFSRQEYWSGLPFPTPRDLPDPGTEPMSPALQALPLSHRGSPIPLSIKSLLSCGDGVQLQPTWVPFSRTYLRLHILAAINE